ALLAGKPTSAKVLFLAAHPDDETIGASGVLGRLTEPAVIYLTDGAPRDPKLRSPHVTGSRDMYALVRAEEAASALALAGVPTSRISFLNAIDQEAIFDVYRLLEHFVQIAESIAPDFIITHPYEGGHPDHDPAALVAHVAASRLRRSGNTPAVLEFTSYHASAGRRVPGEFLPSKRNPTESNGIRIVLSAEERARKARMLSCYVSQWHV